MTATTELESMVRALFSALDRKDFAGIVSLAADDVQSVDEISRGWLRGRAAMDAYLTSLEDEVSNIHSSLSDLHAVELGDIGIVTFVLDQAYDVAGERTLIHAPSSIVFRRMGGAWRFVLLHSVPLAEES